jgi:hypothetical protein
LKQASKKGHQAVRQAVLSAAAQQKLILCSALLSEVREIEAAVLYNLHISLSSLKLSSLKLKKFSLMVYVSMRLALLI